MSTPYADELILTSNDSSYFVAKGMTISFVFPRNEPYVDVKWSISGKVPNTMPEGGWLCFPFHISDPQFIVGRLGGNMDLAKDQITGGNRYLYAVNTGAAIVSTDKSGVGICAVDAPLMSFGEPGLWKYDYTYLPKKSSVFVNVYNNMWNTDYPYWTEGSWSERVRIWPIGKNESTTENLAVKSWEARVALQYAYADDTNKDHSNLPAQNTGISVSRKGVLVTAFGDDPDGNTGTLLRLWEQAGKAGQVIVQLSPDMKFKWAIPVNLRGEITGKKILIKNSSLSIALKPYEPISFILQ
jgi:hypothetical protein